jgi:hypothetical protein
MKPLKGAKVRCKVCGFRIRGTKHEEGDHHKNGRQTKKPTKIRRNK